jgi:predicted AAA+ superfamily ATPase
LPLSFREYLQHTNFPQFEQISTLPPLHTLLNSPGKSSELKKIQKLTAGLRRQLNKYQLSGGFPQAVNDLFSQDKITQSTYEVYLTWLRGDITKYGRSEHLARQILYELAGLQTARVEWQTIARKIEIDAHTTVMDYAHLLEDIFALKILYQVDFNKKKIQPKKRKKIFFLDPLILWCVKGWNEKWGNFFLQTKRETLRLGPALAEGLAAQQLFREDKENWQAPSVFFWHNGSEIDFLVYDKNGNLVPIEVKHQNQVGEHDLAALKKLGFKKGLVISKNDLAVYDNFAILPLETFLALP